MMQMNNPMQMFAQFKRNPMALFAQRRWNIPQDIMNDSDAIVNHLLRTRQVSQEQINYAYQQMGRFGR